jgi:hypothetical protein
VNLFHILLGTYIESGCCDWEGFKGDLDEVALWRATLSPEDVARISDPAACR